ncbi:hypothetical protein FB99_16910 [Pantoea agglomerans]|nr:hypothetical protein FB99_16910 [Pantoea agglomerans]
MTACRIQVKDQRSRMSQAGIDTLTVQPGALCCSRPANRDST